MVLLPNGSSSDLVGTTWSRGLDNFSFSNNTYFAAGRPASAPLFNTTGGAAPGGEGWAAWQGAGKDGGSALADPQFTSLDPTFTLAPSSPALARGFVPIDTSAIGPRTAAVGAPGRAVRRSALELEPELVRMGLAR